jgi:hypothetical protein
MAERAFLNRATFFGVSILLFDAGETPKEIPKYRWVHLANEGLYKGHHQGEFNLTRLVFEAFIRNLREDPQYLAGKLDGADVSADGAAKVYTGGIRPVLQYDYEHASEMPGSEGSIPASGAPAMGWVLDLAVRSAPNGKAQLWAFTELGDQIRGQICRNEYRWVSIAFTTKGVHWVTGLPVGPVLTSVAFTNHNFMRDLESLAAANRGASAAEPVSVQPTSDPSLDPAGGARREANSQPVAGALMADELRERICKRLSIRLAVDDAAVADAVDEAATGAGDLKSLLEALGVPNPADAMKVLPALKSAREKLASLLTELDSLMAQDAVTDAAVGVGDVGAAMKAQGFVGEGAKKALGAYRAACVADETKKLTDALKPEETLSLSARREAREKGRQHFLREYGIKDGGAHVHLSTPLVATKGGAQLTPPVLPIDDRADGGAEVIDLRGVKGANTIEKIVTHLKKTEPGFDKLGIAAQIGRASHLRRTAQLTQ